MSDTIQTLPETSEQLFDWMWQHAKPDSSDDEFRLIRKKDALPRGMTEQQFAALLAPLQERELMGELGSCWQLSLNYR